MFYADLDERTNRNVFPFENKNIYKAHLLDQQQMFSRLRHRTVRGGHHQNGAVHLRRTDDHVFDEIRVAGTVDVCVFPFGRLVTDVRYVNGYTSGLLFRSFIDLVVSHVPRQAVFLQDLGNRRGKRSFSMIDVPNRTYIGKGGVGNLFYSTVAMIFASKQRVQQR